QPTFAVLSPGCGIHLWYRYAGVAPTVAGMPGPGVDIRGHHGFILLPGACSRQGVPYAIFDDLPMAEASAETAAVFTAWHNRCKAVPSLSGAGADHPINTGWFTEFIDAMIAAGDVSIEGEYGSTPAMHVACQAVRLAISFPKFLELAAPWNALCSPPWDELGNQGLEHKYKSALTKTAWGLDADDGRPLQEKYAQPIRRLLARRFQVKVVPLDWYPPKTPFKLPDLSGMGVLRSWPND
ncbi:MAG: hypothetical protein L0Z50_33700, partial [Verrucomicrobiales bacterium]|nr:hypothetical protein [Verrucomicrobiales bacterium]